MKDLSDFIKAIVLFIVGVMLMSTLATIPGAESSASLGLFLIIMAFIVVLISLIVPLIRKVL